MKSKILAIIPARRGSKGIINKNIQLINDKPLIFFTIDVAKKSKLLDRILVSTDSEKIASIGKSYGAEVLNLRPKHLAEDNSSTIDVVQYELKNAEAYFNEIFDYVCVLQPTAPLRIVDDINKSIQLILDNEKSDSLISCYEGTHVHPNIMYINRNSVYYPFLMENKLINRQDFDKVFVRNGAIYISSRNLILEKHRIVGDNPKVYLMPRERSINIDEQYDLKIVRLLMEHRDGLN